MVKAFPSGRNKSKQEDEQKSRKKLAKKDAKLLAQVDQAKKDVRKAEQKATKAQIALQEQQTRLRKLEDELTQFRHAGQEASTEGHDEAGQAEPATAVAQGAAAEELQASSLPAEGRNDIDASTPASSDAYVVAEADSTEVQLSSPTPVEGLSDRAQEDATNAPEAAINTPVENIPTGQFDEPTGAQIHTGISINPAPTDEDLTISSGEGSIPVVTNDEHAWPPPQIREELAESITEDVAREHQAASHNEQNEVAEAPQGQAATGNGHNAVEENFAISSGEGSIPVVTNDEHAWPPPQIREELAESIAEEVAQEHTTADDQHSEAHESDAEEEAENHDAEHEESSSRPRRTTRRRTRSNTQQDTSKDSQE